MTLGKNIKSDMITKIITVIHRVSSSQLQAAVEGHCKLQQRINSPHIVQHECSTDNHSSFLPKQQINILSSLANFHGLVYTQTLYYLLQKNMLYRMLFSDIYLYLIVIGS